MKIPIIKIHIDNQFKAFSQAYSTLCLEENRVPENLQKCKESIYGLKSLIDTLDTKLEQELLEKIK